MTKPTGLAAFSRKGSAAAASSTQENSAEISAARRERGKGDIVALTVRLPRAEWERVHQLAVAEGVSIQALAVDGLSKVFIEKGLPSLK
ncbi:hypothetical protein [uncultured Deefgea sp.]|uniref:hypothetical protein n=1 Tax=uncultured Deefgea sp. TaxID=1304914 RepID=UPI0026260331|nr:hypothetical protein [uncultured Deefgea sp.]